MNFDLTLYPYGELTDEIISAAMAIHREPGPGLDEKIYENSLCIEFAERSIHFAQQEIFPVHYHQRYVGKLITDLIVDSKVVVETKVVDQIIDVHIAQCSQLFQHHQRQSRLDTKFQTGLFGHHASRQHLS